MDFDLKVVAKAINEMMWKSQKTLSTAESCTAGRIASVLTAIPGSSNYYKGGLICYADEVKSEILGVEENVIKENTAVCEEVVKQMVIGANKAFHTDYAIAVSGFAGPGGGSGSVLVGTIWIAIGKGNDIKTLKIEGDEGRDKNLANATNTAMRMLLDYIKEQEIEVEE